MAGFSPYSIKDIEVVALPEAFGQSFKKGEVVYLDGGKVKVASANPQDVYGIALQDASGIENTSVKVARIKPGSKWVAKGSATPSVSNQGVAYGLAVSDHNWTVDFSATINTTVYVESIYSADNSMVVVSFKTGVLQA